MSDRSKTGLEILQVALGIGILGDVLLRATPWGLNVLLFNVAFVVGLVVLLRRRAAEHLTAQTLALMGAQVFFSAMFVWRDSNELKVANSFAILAILAVVMVPKMNITAKVAGVIHYAAGFIWASVNALFAPAALLTVDVDWKGLPATGWRKHVLSVLRGVVIATPLLLIFGALFVAADAAYEGWVQRAFNINFETLFSHAILFAVFSWFSAGYLRGILMKTAIPVAAILNDDTPSSVVPEASPVERVTAEDGEQPVTLHDRSVVEHLNISDPPNSKDEAKTGTAEPKKNWDWAKIDNTLLPQVFTLGTVEVAVILGLMNLLFLSFVMVQVPYLFGGMEFIRNTPDLGLAQYARRGFGELVAVSALVLPVLLVGHWLIRKTSTTATKLFTVLASVQIALLFVIMASAVQRLFLLTGNLGYGMTTVRLYPLIFMAWLAVVFVWFGGTVLRGARQYFAWGALWSAFFFLGATHFLNPDAFIAKTNIALMREGREFDAHYHVSELSADALPSLIEAFPELSDENKQMFVRRLARKYCERTADVDLRNYNISRAAVWPAFDAEHGFIEQLGGCDSPLVGTRRDD